MTTRVWRVWRQDYHGNEFPVATFKSREEADAACVRYSAQPHHQHYWVAPCQVPPDGPDSKV